MLGDFPILWWFVPYDIPVISSSCVNELATLPVFWSSSFVRNGSTTLPKGFGWRRRNFQHENQWEYHAQFMDSPWNSINRSNCHGRLPLGSSDWQIIQASHRAPAEVVLILHNPESKETLVQTAQAPLWRSLAIWVILGLRELWVYFLFFWNLQVGASIPRMAKIKQWLGKCLILTHPNLSSDGELTIAKVHFKGYPTDHGLPDIPNAAGRFHG